MTIPSLSIIPYISTLKFPFPVWDECWSTIAAHVTQDELLSMAGGKVLVGNTKGSRLSRIRLTVSFQDALDIALHVAAWKQQEVTEENRRLRVERERPPGEYLARLVSSRKFVYREHLTEFTAEGVAERTGLWLYQHKGLFRGHTHGPVLR